MKQEIIDATVIYICDYCENNLDPPTPGNIQKKFNISLSTTKNRIARSMDFLSDSIKDYYWIVWGIVKR